MCGNLLVGPAESVTENCAGSAPVSAGASPAAKPIIAAVNANGSYVRGLHDALFRWGRCDAVSGNPPRLCHHAPGIPTVDEIDISVSSTPGPTLQFVSWKGGDGMWGAWHLTDESGLTRCGKKIPVHREWSGPLYVGLAARRVRVAETCKTCRERSHLEERE